MNLFRFFSRIVETYPFGKKWTGGVFQYDQNKSLNIKIEGRSHVDVLF